MSADTPIPFTPPDGVIVTTMASARHVGHGQVACALKADEIDWCDLEWVRNWSPTTIVWWRPTPERTVTIELPESVVRRLANTCWWREQVGVHTHRAARAALKQLDDDK